jgi:hypothetical protein
MPNFMTSLSRDPFVVLRSVFPGGAESSLEEFRLTKTNLVPMRGSDRRDSPGHSDDLR